MRVWLKKLRLQREFTQEDVSSHSNIERPYYTMIEQGNRNPSVKVAKAIAITLGFEWTIFFDNQCNESKQYKEKIS